MSRLKDPFGLDQVMRDHRAVPMMPAMRQTTMVYTPAAQVQQRRAASQLSAGRIYKPKG